MPLTPERKRMEIFDGERLDGVNENLKLIQKTDGLTFGTDAYLLAAYMRGAKNARGAELGSGSGIVSMLCTEKGKLAKIYAFEVQEDFAALTSRNAALNGFADRIKAVCADVRDVKSTDTDGEVDVVFTNPPYMKTNAGRRNENDGKYIARHEVCGNIGDFCAAANRLLRYGGLFYCVYRPDRLSDLISAMRENKLEPKKMTFVCADAAAPPSMVLVEAKKGGAAGLSVTPALLVYSEASHLTETDRFKKIYEDCAF